MQIKWQLNFTSLAGKPCRVDIYKDQAQSETWTDADIIQLIGAPDPFMYEEDDSDDLLQFYRTKSGYIRFYEPIEGYLEDVTTADNASRAYFCRTLDIYPTSLQSRYVKAYYDNQLVFIGYVKQEGYNNDFTACPRIIELPVVSPLAIADQITFDSTLKPKLANYGLTPMTDLLTQALTKLAPDYIGVRYPVDADYANQTDIDFPFNIKMPTIIVAPYNQDFDDDCYYSYDDTANVFKQQNLRFLLEGICTWLGWYLHDDGAYITYQELNDYGHQRQIPIPYNNTAVINNRLTVSLDNEASVQDANATRYLIAPKDFNLSGSELPSGKDPLTIDYCNPGNQEVSTDLIENGEYKGKVTFSYKHPTDSTITAEYIPQYPIYDCIIGSSHGTFAISTFTAPYGAAPDRWFCRIPSKENYVVISKTFYGANTSQRLRINIKLAFGDNIYSCKNNVGYDWGMRLLIKQGDYYYFYGETPWGSMNWQSDRDYRLTDIKIDASDGTAVIARYGWSLSFDNLQKAQEPFTISLLTGPGLPAGYFVRIDEFSVEPYDTDTRDRLYGVRTAQSTTQNFQTGISFPNRGNSIRHRINKYHAREVYKRLKLLVSDTPIHAIKLLLKLNPDINNYYVNIYDEFIRGRRSKALAENFSLWDDNHKMLLISEKTGSTYTPVEPDLPDTDSILPESSFRVENTYWSWNIYDYIIESGERAENFGGVRPNIYFNQDIDIKDDDDVILKMKAASSPLDWRISIKHTPPRFNNTYNFISYIPYSVGSTISAEINSGKYVWILSMQVTKTILEAYTVIPATLDNYYDATYQIIAKRLSDTAFFSSPTMPSQQERYGTVYDDANLELHMHDASISITNPYNSVSTVYWTIDGSDPRTSSTRQSGTTVSLPVSLESESTTYTVKAICQKTISRFTAQSQIEQTTVTTKRKLDTPSVTYYEGIVTFSSLVSSGGFIVYYTTDGTTPGVSDTTEYTSGYHPQIELTKTTTLKFYAEKPYWVDSDIKTQTITV